MVLAGQAGWLLVWWLLSRHLGKRGYIHACYNLEHFYARGGGEWRTKAAKACLGVVLSVFYRSQDHAAHRADRTDTAAKRHTGGHSDLRVCLPMVIDRPSMPRSAISGAAAQRACRISPQAERAESSHQ